MPYKDQETRRAHDRAYREINRARLRETNRAYYAANKERRNAQMRSYREAHPEKLRTYELERRAHKTAMAREYRLRNQERIKQQRKGYHAAILAGNQRRRARRTRQCPAWARSDPRIEALFQIAAWLRNRGDDVHVDHVFPLKPKRLDDPRGLHVYANLRIVDASTNTQKNNRQPTEQEIAEQRFLM